MMEQAAVEYLVNALWQVPLIAAGAWLLSRLAKLQPQAHHRLWLAVLCAAVLLPIHGIRVRHPETQAPVTSRPELVGVSSIAEMPAKSDSHFFPRVRTMRLTAVSAKWLVRLYLATVALGLLRIARAWNATRVLLALAPETSCHGEALAHYSRRFGVNMPQLRESEEVSSPMVVGIVRPVLLLPRGFETFTREEVEAALCHELAHIRRRDYLVNMACQFVALPLVWHPVMRVIQQRIRLTRELVCDAMAAQEMKSEIGYARCLLALAQSILGEDSMTRRQPSIGLFSHNTLEERVTRLMDTTTMNLRRKVIRLAGGAAVMLASTVLAASFHLSPMMAESQTEVSPQTSSPAEPSAPVVAPADQPKTQPKSALKGTRKAGPAAPLRSGRGDNSAAVVNAHEWFDSATFKKQVDEAQQQVLKAKAMFDSPEFKKQFEFAQQQAEKTKAMFDSPEFKAQFEDAQRQAAKSRAMFDSPEFKRQMEDAHQQAVKAGAMFDGPEFKKQFEFAQQEATKAKAMFDSPEFKKQMEDAQQQAAKAGAMFDSPEFKKQFEFAQREAAKAAAMFDHAYPK